MQKFLADCGVASRRKAEELIKEGKVCVNGEIVRELGVKVTLGDAVTLGGKAITFTDKKMYILLNKPVGTIVTSKDERGRQTVMDLVSDEITARIFPVGRLDIATSGAIILTNDGDVAYALTHPSMAVDKQYEVVVAGEILAGDVEKVCKGIYLDGRKTAPARLDIIKQFKNKTHLRITIHEGRNRQIRRMFDAIGHKVLELNRAEIGNILLGNLPVGRFRHLNPNEIKYLRNLCERRKDD